MSEANTMDSHEDDVKSQAEASLSSSTSSWSISIKPVGSEKTSSDFIIEVSPEDDVSVLYNQIEEVTGLKASQQRLIYRGRLIPAVPTTTAASAAAADAHSAAASMTKSTASTTTTTSSSSSSSTTTSSTKIKDIAGLSDGHAIHLVQRRDTPEDLADANSGGAAPQRANSNNSESDDTDLFPSASSAAPLLAALLGLGSTEDDDQHPNGGRRWRSARYGTSRRRFHHRLTQDDLELSDPGSMESVRQGMITLHTLLPAARQPFTEQQLSNQQQQQQRNSSYPHRRWYVGQWIDCLDTVNQWLEATIMEIVHADEVLPPRRGTSLTQATATTTSPSSSTSNRSYRSTFSASSEPFITAGDLDGRRRLLLEPCEPGDSDDEGGELSGFRRRESNYDKLQLLLVHYNGWPHRWDEWIRSDSERLRPFRVRTRHPNVSSHASPTPQSDFNEAPSTHIRNSEARDREVFLPELHHVMTSVNQLVSQAVTDVNALYSQSSSSSLFETAESSPETDRANLPWTNSNTNESSSAPPPPQSPSQSQPCTHGDTETKMEAVEPCHMATESTPQQQQQETTQAQRAAIARRELAALAPLLDRLGRTLVDAAPHLAYLASTLAEHEESAQTSPPELEPIEEHPTSLGGLLSLLSRDRRRQSHASNNVVVPGDNISNNESSVHTGEEESVVDPDHTDFAYGLVNTTRGEVRRGPRTRAGGSSGNGGGGDDAAGILGAYLAAASLGNAVGGGGSDNDDDGGAIVGLGRLLRERGNGGGGIDIHIHAVVTGPGMPAGALGLTTLGGGGGGGGGLAAAVAAGMPTATPIFPTDTAAGSLFSGLRNSRGSNNNSSSNNTRNSTTAAAAVSSIMDDDDLGIFAELYSENPEPVNPNRSPLDGGDNLSISSGGLGTATTPVATVTPGSTSSSVTRRLSPPATSSFAFARSQSASAASLALSSNIASTTERRRLSGRASSSRSTNNSSNGSEHRTTNNNSNTSNSSSLFRRFFRRSNSNSGD